MVTTSTVGISVDGAVDVAKDAREQLVVYLIHWDRDFRQVIKEIVE